MIYVIGDVHNYFNRLNTFIDRKKPSLILSCGDFGYWPRLAKYQDQIKNTREHRELVREYALRGVKYEGFMEMNKIKNKECEIRFCDGNHEDHEMLLKLKSPEIEPKIFYQKRGSVFTLPDGRNILFMGGADSIDKNSRTAGKDWFYQENITDRDMNNLPDCRINIVISHTCPTRLLTNVCRGVPRYNSNNIALQIILEKYRPSLWYFGHWHTYKEGFISETQTKWIVLNHITSQQTWWQKLR